MREFKAGDKVIVTEEGMVTGQVFTLDERLFSADVFGDGKAWTVKESLGYLGEYQFELYEGDE